jgi:hypothetical protein
VGLDPSGPLAASVVRVVGLEDGARVELALEGGAGTVFAIAPWPPPAVGDVVRLRLDGGAVF